MMRMVCKLITFYILLLSIAWANEDAEIIDILKTLDGPGWVVRDAPGETNSSIVLDIFDPESLSTLSIACNSTSSPILVAKYLGDREIGKAIDLRIRVDGNEVLNPREPGSQELSTGTYMGIIDEDSPYWNNILIDFKRGGETLGMQINFTSTLVKVGIDVTGQFRGTSFTDTFRDWKGRCHKEGWLFE